MLTRKRVVVGTTHMHLWDEAGNFIASYEKAEDQAMCRFLADMIDGQCYTRQIEAETQSNASILSDVLA